MLINKLLRQLEYLQSVALVALVDDVGDVPDTPPHTPYTPESNAPDPTFNRNENESLTNEPFVFPTEPAGCFSSLNTEDDVGI